MLGIKTNTQRFSDAISLIGSEFGSDVKTLTQRYLDRYSHREGLGRALHLDGRDNSSAQETQRRNLLRATLLLAHAVGGIPLTQTQALKHRWAGLSATALRKEMESRLPLFDYSPVRDLWDPMNFTQAKDPPPKKFRYIVFGMMNTVTGRGISYKNILEKPTDLLQSFLLSTSLIDEAHVSTYYPYGFILTVPAQNVISTRAEDQAFKNYKIDTGTMKQYELTDVRSEIRRVTAAYPLLSPDQILAKVPSRAGRIRGQDGDTGYNEVVIMGTSPTRQQIRIAGIFMKVDSKGNRYVRKGRKEGPFVTDEIYTSLKAISGSMGIPIVRLTDPSGENG